MKPWPGQLNPTRPSHVTMHKYLTTSGGKWQGFTTKLWPGRPTPPPMHGCHMFYVTQLKSQQNGVSGG